MSNMQELRKFKEEDEATYKLKIAKTLNFVKLGSYGQIGMSKENVEWCKTFLTQVARLIPGNAPWEDAYDVKHTAELTKGTYVSQDELVMAAYLLELPLRKVKNRIELRIIETY